jgi:hypothetical protein
MKELKEAYDIKKELMMTKDMNELGDILKQQPDINSLNVNSDNTIYVESDKGISSIKKSIQDIVPTWINLLNQNLPIDMIINTLPLTPNTCIIKI